ncbi:MAG: glycosyltransferase [Xanthobacteraceae bacterium]
MHGTSIRAPLRVLYVVPPSEHFAGIERVVHEIAGELARAHAESFEVHVVYCKDYPELAEEPIAYEKHMLDARRLRSLFWPLYQFLRQQQFDLIICAQVEPSLICWVASRLAGGGLFIPHLHGNPRIERSLSWMSRLLFAAFRQLVARDAPEIFAVSPSLAAHVRRTLTRGQEVRFLPNPAIGLVDGATMPERREPIFLSVARLCRQKGQDVLLKAFAKTRAEAPQARLQLVGAGPDEPMLRALAQSLKLGDSVEFCGFQTDLTRYYRSARVFVMPSRWDGFALVLLQALAFGLPLVATNCDFGPADLVTDPRLGRVVGVEDIDGLAQAMLAALADVPTEDTIAFRRAAAARYAIPIVGSEHAKALREIANYSHRMAHATFATAG